MKSQSIHSHPSAKTLFALYTILLTAATSLSSLSAAPGQATLFSPSGTVTQERPTFDWNTVNGAEWYQIYFVRDGQFFYSEWIQTNSFWVPSGNFQDFPGNFQWYIRTWGGGEYGPWSASLSFSIPPGTPGQANPISPTGGVQVTAANPTFQWQATDPAATWYQIWLNSDGKKWHSFWVEGTTSFTTPWDFQKYPGNYSWWVQTWNPKGYGPWSTEATFSVPSRAPAAPTLNGPTGTVTDPQPIHSWSSVGNAEWYQIWITRNGAKFHSEWIQVNNSWTPAWSVLAYPGAYEWWVQGWNSIGGYGDWSNSATYVVNPSQNGGDAPVEQRAFMLVNQYRTSINLPALAWNEAIANSCRQHSANMASGAVPFGHDGFDARCNTLFLQIGGSSCAENVALNQGYSDPAYQAYIGWLNSPGHKDNIEGNYTITGMGVIRRADGTYYLTQIFMR